MSTLFQHGWLAPLVGIAKEAGEAIMAIYAKDDFGVVTKSDDSPVTAADLASHKVIVQQLMALTPDVPIISEESADISWQERQEWQAYWLIDPLDGTKEFIKRNGEFTVNIAFVYEGRAVAGVVYAPVLDKCFYGSLNSGAWLQCADSEIALPQVDSVTEVPRIVGSRSHVTPELEAYLQRFGEHEMKSVGSSLKFCLLAEGQADIYPRLGPTCEWDTAAAQAVLESAGGRVLNYDSRGPLSYNQKEDYLNPYFIAYAPNWEEGKLA
ncbi:3'(2'),5'-bisphosphate nucleotidase CysQ [Shewanella sairae]|uniref:3'(2'),5'-bisphosphate nucleotidase CysQ n=1 Tax=Shewanella sairae TaxID=190310 RepID=UPI001C7EA3E4|nr:3'(2'),5'-bisphosphate nucleotidase CysQ [Shewanella sairae]MCL1131384.1 3'(2'),5'-bisphosphate nucleotidase CysQ [Shewanella sairae]